jgi:formylglycine-generating enzyme required for sulfatase activity
MEPFGMKRISCLFLLFFFLLLVSCEQKKVVAEDIDYPEMVKIPAGEFMMGTDTPEDGVETLSMPLRDVKVSSFLVSKTLIPRKLFEKCVKETNFRSSKYTNDVYGDIDEYAPNENSPMIFITWNEMIYFCNWLSIKAKIKPVYTINYNKIGKIEKVIYSKNANGYRLLTEAEFEYLLREGGKTKGELDKSYRWNDAIYSQKPLTVWSGNENAFSVIFLRNINEYVWDPFGKYLNKNYVNPTHPDIIESILSKNDRVKRSTWGYGSYIIRIRSASDYCGADFCGFRVARKSK